MDKTQTQVQAETMRHAHRGNINTIFVWVVGFIVLGVTIVIGFKILGQIQSTNASGSYEYNATNQTQYAMSLWPQWFTTFVNVVAGVSILILLIGGTYFIMNRMNGGAGQA